VGDLQASRSPCLARLPWARGGGGSTAPTDIQTYVEGEEVTAKAALAGFTGPVGRTRFTGWNTVATPTTGTSGTSVPVPGTYTVVAADADSANVITLHAQWVHI